MLRTAPVLLLIPALLCSCSRAPSRPPLPEEGTGRPGPAYIQWLESQSLLRRTPELLRVVSGSSLGWRELRTRPEIAGGSGVWLAASPDASAWNGRESFFSRITRDGIPFGLAAAGMEGILTGCAFFSEGDWTGRAPKKPAGDAAVLPDFSRAAGTSAEHDEFLSSLHEAGLMPGGELLPANPGAGPDFELAVRNVRDYPSLFAMAEIPAPLLRRLPSPGNDGKTILSKAGLDGGDNFLPPLASGNSPASGWAATAPVTGVDGVERRWAYRWHGSPDRPVLHWDDPACTARRVMEASLILQAGMRHQALCAVSAEAWSGLVPPGSGREAAGRREPELTALRELSRSAERYGCTLLLEDPVPPEDIPCLLETGTGFVRDTITPAALRLAAASGDARPLARSLNRTAALGEGQKRLWHGHPCFMPPLPDGCPSPVEAARTASLRAGGGRNAFHDALLLQTAVQAFLPGLLLIDGSELDGTLPAEGASAAVWRIDGAPATRRGLAAGEQLLPGRQAFLKDLATLTALRSRLGLAKAVLLGAEAPGDGSVLLVRIALPDGSRIRLAANFSAAASGPGQYREAAPPPMHWTWSRI